MNVQPPQLRSDPPLETSRGGVGGSHPPHSSIVGISANFIGDPAMEKNKNSLVQEVRQKRDISERRSKD